jgi:hypothetical protein
MAVIQNYFLLPGMSEVNVPKTLARVPEGHYLQWVNACIAGFGKNELSLPLIMPGHDGNLLMGNLALRSWNIKDSSGKGFPGRKKLLWDAKNMKITNFDEANQFVKREYRDGWKLSV